MLDTQYRKADKKKILILYRAVRHYPNSSVQSTVKFLFPRVPEDSLEKEIREEWERAKTWWEEKIPPETLYHLEQEYETALSN